MGRAEGLEGDADALAEKFVRFARIGEDKACVDTGGPADFESGPVPCFKAVAQTSWSGYYRSAHFGRRET